MIKGNVIRQVNDGGNTWVDCSEEAFKRAKENGTPVREVHLNDESFRAAFDVWQDKTDWVQKDRRFDVLKPWGMHRGDVLKAYIDHLEARITSIEESHKQVIHGREHYKRLWREELKHNLADPNGYHIMSEAGDVCADRKTLTEAQQVVKDWNAKWVIKPYYYGRS